MFLEYIELFVKVADGNLIFVALVKFNTTFSVSPAVPIKY
jgi:hypothetical protein